MSEPIKKGISSNLLHKFFLNFPGDEGKRDLPKQAKFSDVDDVKFIVGLSGMFFPLAKSSNQKPFDPPRNLKSCASTGILACKDEPTLKNGRNSLVILSNGKYYLSGFKLNTGGDHVKRPGPISSNGNITKNTFVPNSPSNKTNTEDLSQVSKLSFSRTFISRMRIVLKSREAIPSASQKKSTSKTCLRGFISDRGNVDCLPTFEKVEGSKEIHELGSPFLKKGFVEGSIASPTIAKYNDKLDSQSFRYFPQIKPIEKIRHMKKIPHKSQVQDDSISSKYHWNNPTGNQSFTPSPWSESSHTDIENF